jgi:hypothetical protein
MKILILAVFASLPTLAFGAANQCLDSGKGYELRTVFDADAPLLATATQIDGSHARTAYLTSGSACGAAVDFKKDCTSASRSVKGQYEFTFKCPSASGMLYLDEFGGGELKCTIGDKTDVRVFSGCAAVKNPPPADTERTATEKLGDVNFVEARNTVRKAIYGDFAFESGAKSVLKISRYDFSDTGICGRQEKAVFDLLSVKAGALPVIVDRLYPIYNVENRIPLSPDESYVLRAHVYDFTCRGPTLTFDIEP